MWNDLSAQWRIAFEEAWEAFLGGGIPIGAAIFDPQGRCLVRDRNRTAEEGIPNRSIAHAEANALRRLDTAACDVREAVLYTTMEPCPMCMGTAVMANIKHLRYAAGDPYCGCVHWKDADPYLRGKRLDYTRVGGEMELAQLAMQSYHELQGMERGGSDVVLERFRAYSPRAVAVGEALFAERALDRMAERGASAREVYDAVASRL